MGNCQAAEATTVVIRHPGGRVERLYWPTPASEVMRSHPGHYVALITLCHQPGRHQGSVAGGGVRFTRVRLLRPKDTLVPGQVYRLVTSQEVMKGLRARKPEKMRAQMDPLRKQRTKAAADGKQGPETPPKGRMVDPENDDHQVVVKQESSRQRAAQTALRRRQWRPSLQSIAEAGG